MGEYPLASTWVKEVLCESKCEEMLAVGKVPIPRAAPSLVEVGETARAGLQQGAGAWAGGALILLSRRPPWRWVGCGRQALPHPHPLELVARVSTV